MCERVIPTLVHDWYAEMWLMASVGSVVSVNRRVGVEELSVCLLMHAQA